MGEKDMGEVIGGSHLRALVVCRNRNRDGIDQLTLKMGWFGEEEQGKKSEGSNHTGQKGGPW